jgi:glc operon protein GlcG
MSNKKIIEELIAYIEKLIPVYLENPEDRHSQGNVAICIIDEDGTIYSRMYGKDKLISRRSYQLAWSKASQVWITGYKTGEYERLVFTNQIPEEQFGIQAPDFIGWEGGQPIKLKNGAILAIGFSGFRGVSDLDIVQKAVQAIDK